MSAAALLLNQPFPVPVQYILAALVLIAVRLAPHRLVLKPSLLRLWWSLARRPVTGPLALGAASFMGSALLGTLRRPEPQVSDEFSYLLAADTFARGRLTNPAHPLWRFFESAHTFQQPTYMSKYPPAQGLILALGQKLFGDPLVGVWLSGAVACAVVTWALRGWTGRLWAVLGGLLMVIQFGVAGYWAQSYWGGMMQAAGGALVFGAIPRLRRDWRTRDVAVFYVGAVMLANSRPYEGLIAVLTALGYLAWAATTDRPQMALLIKRVVPAGLCMMVLSMLAMGYYNRKVTGDSYTLPHSLYERTHLTIPSFAFLPLAAPPDFADNQAGRQFLHIQQIGISLYRMMQSPISALYLSVMKLKTLWAYFFGPLLSIPLLLTAWRDPRRSVRWMQTGLVMLFSGLLFLPTTIVTVWVLCGCTAVQLGIAFRVSASPAARFAFFAVCLEAIAILPETWSVQPHYFAPVTLPVLLWTIEIVRMSPPRRAPVNFSRRGWIMIWLTACAALLSCRSAAQLLQTRTAPGGRFMPDYMMPNAWSERRAAIKRGLEDMGGKHLVIVNYSANHSPDQDWVYNEADIDAAPVVWAHDLGPTENLALVSYYKNRRIWRIFPDSPSNQQPAAVP